MSHRLRTTLYHGTIFEIEHIDVNAGHDRKDFGKGFYMAVTKQQAIGMMKKKYRDVSKRNENISRQLHENLYEIHLDAGMLNRLNIKIFEEADLEWLDFVLMCRGVGGIPHEYDLVVGPTADDNTAYCLRMYEDGAYGEVGSMEARKLLRKNLEVEKLGVQYFIGKQVVADQLIIGIRKIPWG